ncbi:hypothetical protein C8034_v007037 [Colletotrichum sidae]|uniref:Uncharacterized protein n=1 Tax=Colletotrichum sidae TaxID=1347389 RepID=A0A4V3I4C8_9PEZI|nr:hypothetical protein C8034_v007037 [Colletotrichum sidae]
MTALLTATSILGDDGRPTYEEAMRHSPSSLSIMRCSAVGSRRSLSLHDGTLAPSVLRLRHKHHHACLRNQVTGITVSPSGLIAATHSEPHGHAASVTRVWDFRGKAAKLVSAEIDDCSLVTYSSTGRFNASIERAAGTKRVKLRDGESKNWKASLDGVGRPAAFGAEGRMFAATDNQGVVVVYGALGGSGNTLPTKKVAAVVNHGDTTHVQFLPNGRDIVTLSRDGTVRVSEARTGRTLRRMEVDGMAVAGA